MDNKHGLKMQEMPEQARPYERIYDVGATLAGDSELLAVLIQSGTSGSSALDIAHQLLSDRYFGSVESLADASLEQLQSVPGIGPVKAVRIAAALELGRRRTVKRSGQARACDTPARCAEVFIPEIGSKDREAFAVLFLNRRNQLIRSKVISEGSLSKTIIEPREVFREGLKYNAASMVLGHNHPSGNLEPSSSDIHSTTVFIQVGKLMGMPVLDHLIVSKYNWLSLRQKTAIFGDI